LVRLYDAAGGLANFYSSLSFSRAGRSFSDLLWTIMPCLKVIGSVPWFYGGSQYGSDQGAGCHGTRDTYLHVLFCRLLPFLGHGARSHRIREQASDAENQAGSGDDAGGEEEDLAALIRRRGSSWAVGTEGNIVRYELDISQSGLGWR
jgi:hypothetical protein